MGATAAAGLALAVRASAEYGAKMAQLQSLSHASADEMRQLSDAAMKVGQAYGFSATQVADAEIELTKAGIGVKAQLGGALVGALQLAAAGQLEVGRATEIVTVAMTQFGLRAKDVPHLADLLAAGADKALGSVGDLGEALKNGGLQAHNMGLNIDQTVGLLSAFANAGILGAEAGTQMRSMFIQLQKPTKQAQDELSRYGIALSDSSGKFVGITNLAGQLHDKLGKVTQEQRNTALATIFGSHAITGATVLYQAGAKGIDGWIRSVNDAGFASVQAAGKMNSLQGDVQKLSAALQTDLIKAGSVGNDALRGLVRSATGLATVFGNLPEPVQAVAVTVGVVTAGVGLLGGAALLAVPKIAELKLALQTLNMTGRGVAAVFGKGGLAIAGITGVVSGIAQLGVTGTATSQQVVRAGQQMASGWKDVTADFQNYAATSARSMKASFKGVLEGESNGAAGFAKWFDGFLPTRISDAFKSNEGQLAAMGQQLAGFAKLDYHGASASFDLLVTKYRLSGDEVKTLLGLMPEYRDELSGLAKAAGVAASDQNLLLLAQGKGADAAKVLASQQKEAEAAARAQADATRVLAGAASDGTASIKDLQEAIKNLDGGQVSASEAAIALQQAIEAAAGAARRGARGLDIHTKAGQENQHALNSVVRTTEEAAQKYLDAGGSAAGASKIVREGRKAWIDSASAMLGSRDAAIKLADAFFNLPQVQIGVAGVDAAKAQLLDLRKQLGEINGLRASVYVDAVTRGGFSTGQASQVAKNAIQARAAGGPITGPGPKGKDSVLIYAAPGEHVLTAREVDAMGGHGAVYAFRQSLPAYAAGGAVRRPTVNPVTAAQREVDRWQADIAAIQRQQIGARGTTALRLREEMLTARQRLTAARKRLTTAQRAAAAKAKTVKAAVKQTEAVRQAGEDFVSTQIRATESGTPIDPLTYVDQLRQMSRNTTDYTARQRSKFDKTANQYETAIARLAKQSADAATKLTDLKNSADQMRTSLKQAIAGGYQATSAASLTQTGGWVTAGGIRFQTTTTGTSAGSLATYYSRGAADSGTFASQLKQLAGRGVDGRLLAEIAGYGVAQGSPIAAALLSATTGEVASINRDYAAIQTNADAAAGTVTDVNYRALIDAAQKHSDDLIKQLATDAAQLRKLIAQAFGLKGYASGTISATTGLHLVGEQGPELVRLSGGQQIYDTGRTRTWIRDTQMTQRGNGAGTVRVVMPQAMNLIDADGQVIGRVRAEARDIAQREIARDQQADAILVWGGAA